MRRWERDLNLLAKKYGLMLERTKRHYRLLDAATGVVAVTSSSPSDHRTMKNLELQIRRSIQ